MAKEMVKPCTTLAMPIDVLPSIKSVKAFINGTPGIKKSTDVAKSHCQQAF